MALGSTLKEFGVKISLLFDAKKAKEAQKNIEEIGRSLRETGLHVAEAAAALFELSNIASEHSRALEENSEQLGINVEQLQKLQYAAKVAAGVSGEELNGALEGISKTLFDARAGNIEAAQTFIRLGVSLDDIRNPAITADKILAVLADRFQQLPNGIYKTALANAAGGASFAKLLPLLNKGSAGIAALGKEAQGLGVIMGKNMVQQGAEFDRQLSRVWFVIKNVSYTLGFELMKYIWPVVNAFLKWISVNRVFLAQGIAGALKGLGTYLKIVFEVAKFVIDRFQGLAKALGGVERVSKAIGVAFGLFASFKIVSSIGLLIKSLEGVVAVLGLIDAEAILAGAGFLALILIVQDLFSDDSIIKEWFSKFKKEFPGLASTAQGFIDVMVSGVRLIAEGWSNIFSWLQAIKEYFSGGALLGPIKEVLGVLDTVFGYLSSGKLGGKIFETVDYLKNIGSSSNAAPSPGVTNNQSSSNVQQTANITVMVPPNMGAKEATDVVSGGVQDGFDSMLRHGRNQALGGRAY